MFKTQRNESIVYGIKIQTELKRRKKKTMENKFTEDQGVSMESGEKCKERRMEKED